MRNTVLEESSVLSVPLPAATAQPWGLHPGLTVAAVRRAGFLKNCPLAARSADPALPPNETSQERAREAPVQADRPCVLVLGSSFLLLLMSAF